MAPAELHYSRKRLAWLLVLGVLMVALFLWVGLDAADFADGSGRGGRFVRAIGANALRVFAFGLAAACVALTLLYLRLLVGADRMAARADSGGVTLRTAFGTRTLRWSDVQLLYSGAFAPPLASNGSSCSGRGTGTTGA